MEELREIYESQIEITESKDKHILGYLEFVGAKADFKNLNHRTYTKATLEKAVKEFNSEIEKKNVTGILSNLDHSIQNYPSLSKGAHLINKLWMDGDLLKGQATILNTTSGKDLYTILKSGTGAGISMKGFGNIDKKGFIEKDSFKLHSLDIVNKPSFGDITKLTDANLFESVKLEEKEPVKSAIVGLGEFNNLIDEQLKHSYEISFPDVNFNEPNVQKSFEKFCDKNWQMMAEKVEKILKESGRTVEGIAIKMDKNIEDKRMNYFYHEYLESLSNSEKGKTFKEFKKSMEEN